MYNASNREIKKFLNRELKKLKKVNSYEDYEELKRCSEELSKRIRFANEECFFLKESFENNSFEIACGVQGIDVVQNKFKIIFLENSILESEVKMRFFMDKKGKKAAKSYIEIQKKKIEKLKEEQKILEKGREKKLTISTKKTEEFKKEFLEGFKKINQLNDLKKEIDDIKNDELVKRKWRLERLKRYFEECSNLKELTKCLNDSGELEANLKGKKLAQSGVWKGIYAIKAKMYPKEKRYWEGQAKKKDFSDKSHKALENLKKEILEKIEIAKDLKKFVQEERGKDGKKKKKKRKSVFVRFGDLFKGSNEENDLRSFDEKRREKRKNESLSDSDDEIENEMNEREIKVAKTLGVLEGLLKDKKRAENELEEYREMKSYIEKNRDKSWFLDATSSFLKYREIQLTISFPWSDKDIKKMESVLKDKEWLSSFEKKLKEFYLKLYDVQKVFYDEEGTKALEEKKKEIKEKVFFDDNLNCCSCEEPVKIEIEKIKKEKDDIINRISKEAEMYEKVCNFAKELEGLEEKTEKDNKKGSEEKRKRDGIKNLLNLFNSNDEKNKEISRGMEGGNEKKEINTSDNVVEISEKKLTQMTGKFVDVNYNYEMDCDKKEGVIETASIDPSTGDEKNGKDIYSRKLRELESLKRSFLTKDYYNFLRLCKQRNGSLDYARDKFDVFFLDMELSVLGIKKEVFDEGSKEMREILENKLKYTEKRLKQYGKYVPYDNSSIEELDEYDEKNGYSFSSAFKAVYQEKKENLFKDLNGLISRVKKTREKLFSEKFWGQATERFLKECDEDRREKGSLEMKRNSGKWTEDLENKALEERGRSIEELWNKLGKFRGFEFTYFLHKNFAETVLSYEEFFLEVEKEKILLKELAEGEKDFFGKRQVNEKIKEIRVNKRKACLTILFTMDRLSGVMNHGFIVLKKILKKTIEGLLNRININFNSNITWNRNFI